jgi:hypothetical protein
MELDSSYGFTSDSEEKRLFNEIPQIYIENSICGPLLIDDNYSLFLKNSIIDAGKGIEDDSDKSFAISGYGESEQVWGPPTEVSGVTIFGRVRVECITGQGAIFVHSLEVKKTLKGCLRYSYLTGNPTKIPQREGSLFDHEADPPLRFVSEVFGEPAYGRLAHNTCYKIRRRGPDDNAMGAFGFLKEADKLEKILTRFKEFMPVGINPNFILVT